MVDNGIIICGKYGQNTEIHTMRLVLSFLEERYFTLIKKSIRYLSLSLSLSLLEYRAFSTLLMFLIMSSKMHLVSNLAAKAISKYQIIYKIGCVARHIDLHF